MNGIITLIGKFSICSSLILVTSCAIKNKKLRETRGIVENEQTSYPQSFEEIPQQKTFFDLAVRNYEYLWDKKTLSVCWENNNNKNDGQTITEQIVRSEFAKVGFNFIGWKTCDNKGADIRVQVGDQLWPGVDAIGKNLENRTNGMRLTFTFDRAGPTGWAYRCKVNSNYTDNCIRNYALHEFGHAIGLAHEADRADSRCSQKTNYSVIPVGEYDDNSIMNYCYNMLAIQNNEVPRLSDGDISEIKKIYDSNDNSSDNNDNTTNNDNTSNNDNSYNHHSSGQNFVLTGSGRGLVTTPNSLSCPDNGDNSGIQSINSFNFADGSVTVKLSLDPAFTDHTQYFGVEGPGGSLYLRLFRWGNTYQLKARHNFTDLVHKTYSVASDHYLKISHQAAYNRVTFSTSPDGIRWTPFGYRTFTGTSSMKLVYDCGNSPSYIQDIKINSVNKSFK